MKALHHVGITVADLDRAIRFYREVLGCELVVAPSDWYVGDAVDAALAVPGTKLRIAIVAVGDAQIELMEFAEPASAAERPAPLNTRGASHLAFAVDDIDAAKERLELHGVEFNSEVIENDGGPLVGWRWVYFVDPDGYAIEIAQTTPGDPAAIEAGVRSYLEGVGAG